MYRSRSTSSLVFDALNNSDGRSWTAVETPEPYENGGTSSSYERLSSTMRRTTKETPTVTQNTLTSALTGSKMATNSVIPTGAGSRPLPKALQPKSARTPATPSAMYGSSLTLNSPSVVKRDNFSGSLTPTGLKSPAYVPEQRSGVQRMESTPLGSILQSSGVKPTDYRTVESGRWNSAETRPHTAGVYPPGNSAQRPVAASVDGAGRDRWATGQSHPLSSWTPAVNARPVRRRESVVQDSIVPILKAALGKDNDQQDRKIRNEEESVNRQVFGRAGRAGAGTWSGAGTLRGVSMYASTDDVFGRSNSYLQPSPFPGDATLPRVHLKSHSEVLPPRGFEGDLQRKAVRNSMSSAVSASDIHRTKAPGVQEMASMQREFRPYNEFHDPPPIPLEGPPHSLPASRQLSSYGMPLTPADHSSWKSSYSTSNFEHSNGTRPVTARTPSWESTPPLSAPPVPSHSTNYPSNGRPSTNTDSRMNSWYNPIPVEPRKVIMSPSVVLDSPRNLAETKKSSRSLVFFGESFTAGSYPLLANVETEDIVDAEVVDPVVATRNARNAGSPGSANLTADLGWRSGPSGKVNGLSFSSRDFPADAAASVHQRTTSDIEDIRVPSPPIGFRDDTSSSAPLANPTGAIATTVSIPALPISHQATDSMNTEDSGLERWEKDGNDHSADEMDAPAGQTGSAAATGASSTASGHRSSALNKHSSGGSSWREDTSEGRGSLSSSPRPHNNNNSDEQSASPTDDPYLTNSGRYVDDKTVPSNSILRQLLAENARQTTRNFDETTTLHSFRSERESRFLGSMGHSESIDSEPPPPLPPSAPPPLDLESSEVNGGIDSDSCHSYSTAVQSTVTVSGSTVDHGDRSRSTEDGHREHGEDTIRGSAVQESWIGDKGAQRERYAIVGEAGLDLNESWMRLPSFREIQVSPKRNAFEATNYDNERFSFETGRRGGVEEREVEEGGRMVFEIVKGPVGVGFCIEGGKGSLTGDRPIAVKRVFKGGSSDGTVNLRPGDELLSIAGQSLVGLSHYEAWKSIKALPNGTFPLVIRRTRTTNQQHPQLP